MTYSIEQLELPGKHNAVGQLGKAVLLLCILEPLQVEGQDLRQFLHTQPLGGLLLAAALLTVILGLGAQCLVRAEHPVVWAEVRGSDGCGCELT